MQRLHILDEATGVPLFDKIWKWKSDQKSPAAIASLVKFFFQFSSEIDDGVTNHHPTHTHTLLHIDVFIHSLIHSFIVFLLYFFMSPQTNKYNINRR
jgi:hypothetical protein